MLILNEKYVINNGQGSIVFTEGNKGTVNAVYEIKGKKDTGVINGVLEGSLLKGTWHNKVGNTTGLIEFAFNETGFEAKWKQGLEPGPMRGKWVGGLNSDISLIEKNDYTEFDIQGLAKSGLFSFTSKLNEILLNANNLDKDSQFTYMINFFNQLESFVSENPEYAYLENISIKVTQNFYNNNDFSYFPEENENHRIKYCLELNSLRETGLINLVIEAEKLDISTINSDDNEFNKFLNYLSSYFIYSLESIIVEDDATELAEFILSISANNHGEIEDDYNSIVDQILDLLNAYGFDINNYEGECEIEPNYYLQNYVNSGYDYITFCEEIIGELYVD